MEHLAFTVQGVGNRAFQNIKDLIKLMAVNDIIAIFCNFRVKRMLRGGHPVVKNNRIHLLHLPFVHIIHRSAFDYQDKKVKEVNVEQVTVKKSKESVYITVISYS